MKKIGGTRASSARVSGTAPREPWRKWVMTLLALGFAMLVITLLTKENRELQVTMKEMSNSRDIAVYHCTQSGGDYEEDMCSCGEEYNEVLEYDKKTGWCMSEMGIPGGEMGEEIREIQSNLIQK